MSSSSAVVQARTYDREKKLVSPGLANLREENVVNQAGLRCVVCNSLVGVDLQMLESLTRMATRIT